MATFSQDFLRSLTRPSFGQGLFQVGQAIGQMPTTTRAVQQEKERKETLSGFDPNTVEGLTGLAQYYQSQGDLQNAAKLATAARDLATQEANAKALDSRKVQIKSQAENLGLDDLAAQIENVTDNKELGDLVGTMIDYRLKNMPTQTPAQRKQLARQRGISDKLFKELGLGQAPDQVFNDVLTGQRGGDIEFFLKDGKVMPFRTEGGQVYDRENNTWVSAQQLGLNRAPPEIQRIENLSGTLAEKIMGEGVGRLSDGLDAANKAVTSIESIDTSLENIDNMYTGYGATFRMDVARAARVAGIDISDADQIENTEEYASLAGARVADYITNLGAGTGLSDADRTFAERVVAGDIGMSPETMRRLLTTIRKQNVRTINQYNTLRGAVDGELKGSQKAGMAFYPLVDLPPERVEPEVTPTGPFEPVPGLSDEANLYLQQAMQ
jgi:hypothetical protein